MNVSWEEQTLHVSATTLAAAQSLLSDLRVLGFRWGSGKPIETTRTRWEFYSERTYYEIEPSEMKVYYGDRQYRDTKVPLITAEAFCMMAASSEPPESEINVADLL